MTNDQQTLLLYLETCLVDYGGKVENRRMNEDDFIQAIEWCGEGFIRFGRLFSIEANKRNRNYQATHWVLFSEEAWETAHRLRKDRAERLMKKVERNDLSMNP